VKAQYSHEYDQLKDQWVRCKAKQLMPRVLWNNMLVSKLGLNDMEIILIDDFLERFGLIFYLDDMIQTCREFALNKEGDFVYVQISQKDKGISHYVQYTIKVLKED
jgi:hypothetical protein